MESFLCEYCNNIFSTKYSLEYHKKNVKSCLKIQGKFEKKFICNGCDKEFINNVTLQNHINKCTILVKTENYLIKIKNLEELIKEKDNTIKEKDEQINKFNQKFEKCESELSYRHHEWESKENDYERQLRIKNNSYNNLLIKFETTEKLYKIQIEKLENNIKKFNNILNDKIPTAITHEYVKEKVKNHFSKEYLFRGMKGIILFVTEYITKNEFGENVYILCDKSRKKFKYNNGSEISYDLFAVKLKQMLHPPIAAFFESVRNEFETAEMIETNKLNTEYDTCKKSISEIKELINNLYLIASDICALKNSKDNTFVNNLIRQM